MGSFLLKEALLKEALLKEVFSLKFLEKLKARKLSKTLAAVAAGGVLFFGAGNLAEADSNADFAFRQAYLSVSQDNRDFVQNIDFFGTTFHADINTKGNILRDGTMQMSGLFNWAYTNPTNNLTTNQNIPFYITQGNEEITLYVQRNGKWSRFLLPGIPAGFANALKSNDLNTLQENLKAVRHVELFRESNAQQIFNVTLDGRYLAQLMDKYSQNQNNAGLSSAEIASQANFSRNLQAALQKTDVVCTWTVDKTKNRTVTAVFNFTELMRNYAKNILNESAAGTIVLTEEERMLMDTIGYYSEFHYAMSYSTDDYSSNDYAPSSAARKATLNNNIFQDLLSDMTSTVRKR